MAKMKLRSKYADTLSVIVGEGGDQRKFMVYEDLINQNSEFFKAATTSPQWIEASEKTVRLPEQSPSTFQIYLDALHNPNTELFVFIRPVFASLKSLSSAQVEEYYINLTKAWILGDYIGDVRFRNRLMQALLKIRKFSPFHEFYELVAEKTKRDSPLQRWVVETLYRGFPRVAANPQQLEQDVMGLPETLSRQLLLKVLSDPRVEPQNMVPADSQDFFEQETE